jgi:hypothetical protein
VDVSCGVSVFFGRWFSTVFLAVPVLLPSKSTIAWSFFTFDFVRRATPSCTQVSIFPSRNFDLSSSATSVCRPRIIWARRQGVRAKGSVRSSLGSARSLSDHVGALSDRHLAQPGFCPIVTWLSQTSVRSSLGSTRPLSDRVGSLSDRHLAQPGPCPIVPGLYPIVILLCFFIRVVCRWPDSFCDLLFRSSFVVDLQHGLPSTISGFRCGS